MLLGSHSACQQGRAPRAARAVAHHLKLAGLCPFRAVHILNVTSNGDGYPCKYPVLSGSFAKHFPSVSCCN